MTIHQTTIRPAITPAEQRFLDLYASVSEKLPGARSAAVRAWRDAARDAFIMLGIPHRRVEEWKYTDLRALMPEVHPLGGLEPKTAADVSVEAAIGKSLAHLDSYRAVFVQGRFRADLSTIQDAPGVTFVPLHQALDADGASAQAIAKLALGRRDVIAALSTAFATDGAILAAAPKTRLDKPIHLIFISTDDKPALYALQHVISIGEEAEVSLVETHETHQSQAVSHTRLAIGAGASVKHVRLVGSEASKHLASATVTLADGAHYEPLQMAVNGALVRAEAAIRFEGPNARCHYAGAMLLRANSHADFTLVVNHAAPNCESRELVKAVLDGRSRGVFQGKVIVERGAQKTDGKQMANALLLSDDAEFDSKPELEIFADDVVCGHGSTAGQLDEDMLFYLQARGISEAEARSLLIAAFVGEALDSIENEDLRAALDEKVAAWLAGNPTMVAPAL
jgi:Fe-S cluster assembly protein SufD